MFYVWCFPFFFLFVCQPFLVSFNLFYSSINIFSIFNVHSNFFGVIPFKNNVITRSVTILLYSMHLQTFSRRTLERFSRYGQSTRDFNSRLQKINQNQDFFSKLKLIMSTIYSFLAWLGAHIIIVELIRVDFSKPTIFYRTSIFKFLNHFFNHFVNRSFGTCILCPP